LSKIFRRKSVFSKICPVGEKPRIPVFFAGESRTDGAGTGERRKVRSTFVQARRGLSD
jgi:hypothetical protein